MSIGTNDLTVGSLTGSGNITNTTNFASPTITIGSDNTSPPAYTGVISNTGFNSSTDVIKNGTGELTFSGNNTYSGGTTLNAGTFNINSGGTSGSNSAIGTGTLTINGGEIDNTTGGAITLLTNNDVVWSGNFSFGGTKNLNFGNGDVSVSLSSGRTITLNGTNSTITFGGTATNTGNTGTFTVNGSGNTLSLGGFNLTNSSFSRTLTINGSSNVTITGVLANGGSATSGNLTYSGTGLLTLSGSNTYTGVTTISSGVVSVSSLANGSSNSNIGRSTNAAANLVLGGGTLRYTGGNVSIDRNFTLGTGTTSTIEVTSAAANLTISGGAASTNGALVKEGAGTLTLSGSNSYTGTTTVSAGTLQLGASNIISNSSNFSLDGGTFKTGATAGFSETVGTLQLTDNSTVALGTGVHTLTFANSSSVSWTPGKKLTITGWTGTGGASGTAGKIMIGGAGLTATQLAAINFTGYAPGAVIISGELVPTGPPVVNSTLTASSTYGTASSYQITATNNPTSYNATGLPTGMSVNTSTGLIS